MAMQMVTSIGIILLGWLVGAAVNYVADVMPFRRKLVAPLCVYCEHDFSWWSYLTFSPCRQCGRRRSLRALIVQISFLLLTAFLWDFPPGPLGFWPGIVLLAYLGMIAVMDLEYRVVLTEMVRVGVILGAVIGVYRSGDILSTIVGGAFGFGSMWLLYMLGVWFNRMMARRRGEEIDEDALGFGDVNLSGILGLAAGWPVIAASLIVAILLGGVFSGLYLLAMKISGRYTPFTAIPYAPFLILGVVGFLYLPSVLY